MASDEEVETTRKSVKTFVPAYQKAEWKRHADELDMSQSEFVRTMVQAGRRDFDLESVAVSASEEDAGENGDKTGGADTAETTDTTGESEAFDATTADDLDDHVLSVLSASDHLSWEELLDELTNSIEDRLEETLQQLQRDNRVQYSGRRGGYTLVAGDDGD